MSKQEAMKAFTDAEAKTFFMKMVGDYYRYMAENAKDDMRTQANEGALEHYKLATTAGKDLHACNPVKLGVALNLSTFYYENMKKKQMACYVTETALKDAMNKIDDVDDETFNDAKEIIELMKENLEAWRKEDDAK